MTDRLPEHATLKDHQACIRRIVEDKGWTTDPNELFVLLTEEVGELAKEVRKGWTYGKDKVREEAAEELADVFMYLVDIANHFDVDLDAAVRKKITRNEDREWNH